MKLSKLVMEQTGRDQRVAASHERIVQFLIGRVSAFETTDITSVRSFVSQNDAIARRYKITSEQGIARFCLLQAIYHGRAHEVPQFHNHLTRAQGDPEQDLRNLLIALESVAASDKAF